MKKIRKYLEIPYIKFKRIFHKEELILADSRYRNKSTKNTSISIYDLLIFYLCFLGIITISLAVFVGVYSIFKDIFS